MIAPIYGAHCGRKKHLKQKIMIEKIQSYIRATNARAAFKVQVSI